jgi:hypothetical protein
MRVEMGENTEIERNNLNNNNNNNNNQKAIKYQNSSCRA